MCEGYSTDTIEETIRRFRFGKVADHNKSFAPPEPMVGRELARVVEDNLKWRDLHVTTRKQLEERRRDEEFQASKTPESQARVREMMNRAVDNLRSQMSPEEREAADKRRAMHLRASDKPSDVAYRDSEDYKRRLVPFSAGDLEGRDD